MDYTIAGIKFSSKEKARDVARRILASHKIGDKLTGSDSEFMKSLLETHSDASQKIGVGISYIFVASDGMPWGGKCFHIMRRDGSSTDFSYRECLKPSPDSAMVHFIEACRWAVSDQVISVLQSSDIDSPHVHHQDKQFIEIVMSFIKNFSIDVSCVRISEGDNVTVHKFLDNDIASKFSKYHRDNASLVAISKDEHRAIPIKRFR